ncbi:MAG: triose-phosphate isomerase [Actinobacteria bacterium]|nr:triose-phosphate isomerase [Actinomycetota bacterium]
MGPYTGEVSPLALFSIGGKFVMVGHFERRLYFGETDDTINKKILACYRNDIIPLLLIGETLEGRNNNETEKILLKQLKTSLKGIPPDF